VKNLFLLAVLALVLAFVAVLPSGCEHDRCPFGSTRCHGNSAEVCGSDGSWLVALDCDELARQTYVAWVCAEESVGDAGVEHTCVLAEPGPLVADGGPQ